MSDSSRFISQPGDLTQVPEQLVVPATTWEELPTIYRRAVDAYMVEHQERAPGSVFKREEPIQMDGAVAIVYYHDTRTGTRYRARVQPDGSVACAPV